MTTKTDEQIANELVEVTYILNVTADRMEQAMIIIGRLTAERDALKVENERLTARIAELEAALSWVAEHAPGIEISIARYAYDHPN